MKHVALSIMLTLVFTELSAQRSRAGEADVFLRGMWQEKTTTGIFTGLNYTFFGFGEKNTLAVSSWINLNQMRYDANPAALSSSSPYTEGYTHLTLYTVALGFQRSLRQTARFSTDIGLFTGFTVARQRFVAFEYYANVNGMPATLKQEDLILRSLFPVELRLSSRYLLTERFYIRGSLNYLYYHRANHAYKFKLPVVDVGVGVRFR